jgi:cysteine desulfuration protein SufE
MSAIDEIVENFELLDEWDDRYRYVIELGRTLAPLAEQGHVEANKVRGCASQVWLITHIKPDGAAGPSLTFEGDSDAHIVRGLIAILFALYSGKRAKDILDIDPEAVFTRLGLRENLTPQRSNGLRAMVERIRAEAKAALSYNTAGPIAKDRPCATSTAFYAVTFCDVIRKRDCRTRRSCNSTAPHSRHRNSRCCSRNVVQAGPCRPAAPRCSAQPP